MRWKLIMASIAAVGAVCAGPVSAEEVEGAQPAYRDSRLTYRNEVSAVSFARDAELTYNPYYAMSLEMELVWWFDEVLFARADGEVTREFTEADETTRRGEIVTDDTLLNFGAQDFWKIPVVEIGLSADAEITLPTSKMSRGESMMLGTGANLGIDREFDVLDGLTITYTLTPAKYFHKYTTASIETPLIGDCASSAGGCSRFLNTGSRNASWSLTNDVIAELCLTGWASIAARAGVITGFLHPAAASPEKVSYSKGPSVNRRHINYYKLVAILSPMPALDVLFGADALNPQLAPGSTYYAPFLNRYTYVFFALRLNLDGVVEQVYMEGN